MSALLAYLILLSKKGQSGLYQQKLARNELNWSGWNQGVLDAVSWRPTCLLIW